MESKWITKYSLLKVFWFMKIKGNSEIKHTSQIIVNTGYIYKV